MINTESLENISHLNNSQEEGLIRDNLSAIPPTELSLSSRLISESPKPLSAVTDKKVRTKLIFKTPKIQKLSESDERLIKEYRHFFALANRNFSGVSQTP